ncbi:uncharacterized protein LOC119332747 [Triticum dicoccoides]|uniref:uncharacterized protein LOC119332747 n=1 Tax=Triticum dicoccoides TaxID=85692 RepID=UPI0018913CE3|nr:uncharacterized protein LOC119332747 [Triticum dicoccoides]XP_044428316.1 uncharacterized protein LOC123153091 [Triticum aestivum]
MVRDLTEDGTPVRRHWVRRQWASSDFEFSCHMKQLDVVVVEWRFLLTSIFVGVELSGESPIASSYHIRFSLWCQDSGIDFVPLAPFNFLFLADFLGVWFMWTTSLVYIG